MSPKQPKPEQPKSESTSPDVLDEISGGAIDRSHDFAQKLGSIQQSITYLEANGADTRTDIRAQSALLADISKQLVRLESMDKRLETMEPKVQHIQTDVSNAKTAFWVTTGILSTIGSVGGAIAIVLLNKILDALVKHYAH